VGSADFSVVGAPVVREHPLERRGLVARQTAAQTGEQPPPLGRQGGWQLAERAAGQLFKAWINRFMLSLV
jgi:hypothetical protein